MIKLDSTVLQLAPEEVILLTELAEVAKEAKKAAEMLRNAYRFKMGEKKITIWEDCYNAEYLTIDGVWQARYLHQTYDVNCNEKDIYNLFKYEYLYKNKYSDDKMVAQQAEIAAYFRGFLNKTEKKIQ